MKIGIEGQRLFRRKKHGMDIVALELIRNLQHLDKRNEYFVFVKPDEDESCLQETPNFKIIKIEGNNYPYWEQVLLPRAAKKNTKNVLKAYAKYIKRNGPIHKLVMVDYDQEALALLLYEIGAPELNNQI